MLLLQAIHVIFVVASGCVRIGKYVFRIRSLEHRKLMQIKNTRIGKYLEGDRDPSNVFQILQAIQMSKHMICICQLLESCCDEDKDKVY